MVVLCLCGSLAEAQTTLYLRDTASKLGTPATGGVGIGCYATSRDWRWLLASTSSGSEWSTSQAPTSTAPPCHIEYSSWGIFMRWISPPVSSAINLTGNYDYQGKCSESNGNLNAGFSFEVWRWSRTTGGIDLRLDNGPNSTECGTSATTLTIAAHAPTCGSSCNLAVGDRIAIFVFVENAGGTWGGNNSRSFLLYIAGANSFAHFAQTISFASDTNNARPLVH
jgi:hypothetical protein